MKKFTHRKTKKVEINETANIIGSGGLEVYSTPMLIAFMENVAYELMESQILDEETTVGVALNVNHLKPNVVGDELECKVEIIKVEGKKVSFNIEVRQGEVLVGRGTHDRFIVNSNNFMKKIETGGK